MKRSQFRMLFQLTTEKMQARCRLDSFSGSVMQLHKDELLLFIDELHTSLQDYYLEQEVSNCILFFAFSCCFVELTQFP